MEWYLHTCTFPYLCVPHVHVQLDPIATDDYIPIPEVSGCLSVTVPAVVKENDDETLQLLMGEKEGTQGDCPLDVKVDLMVCHTGTCISTKSVLMYVTYTYIICVGIQSLGYTYVHVYTYIIRYTYIRYTYILSGLEFNP